MSREHRAWRLTTTNTSHVDKRTGEWIESRGDGALRGFPLSPQVSRIRLGNPHRVSLPRAIQEARGMIRNQPYQLSLIQALFSKRDK